MSVNAISAVLASPRHTTTHDTLLCRAGRCPVRDCTRPLVLGKRTRFKADQPNGGRAEVRVCLSFDVVRLRAAPSTAGRETRRTKVLWYQLIVLELEYLHVLLLCSCYGTYSGHMSLTHPAQAQAEAAPAAAAAFHRAQVMRMIIARLCKYVKCILVVVYFLDYCCRSLRTPVVVVLSCFPMRVATALPCSQRIYTYKKVDLRGKLGSASWLLCQMRPAKRARRRYSEHRSRLLSPHLKTSCINIGKTM